MAGAVPAGGRHDHGDCVERALSNAQQVSAHRGARMTALRREVLREIWRGHTAVKAYDILERLGGETRSAKPPTVYRALHFLLEHGLVHRLESLNAFVGCLEPAEAHHSQFLICEACGLVREMRHAPVARALEQGAAREGFLATHSTVEMLGRCRDCRPARRGKGDGE